MDSLQVDRVVHLVGVLDWRIECLVGVLRFCSAGCLLEHWYQGIL